MPDLFSLLCQYIEFFPLVVLGSLFLAGLNLPVSEDLIIISAALMSHKEPSLLVYNLAALYVGVISTDIFMYWVGSRVRSGAVKTRFFSMLVPKPAAGVNEEAAEDPEASKRRTSLLARAVNKMPYFLDKYGIATFIVGRFIPFGFRNAMFFSAGFFNLKFRVFIIYDVIAAMISVNTLFFLTYNFGEDAKKPFEIAGVVLFIAFVLAAISLLLRLVAKHFKEKSSG
jgi:membrane protein DedA with SNARE-associated domain